MFLSCARVKGFLNLSIFWPGTGLIRTSPLGYFLNVILRTPLSSSSAFSRAILLFSSSSERSQISPIGNGLTSIPSGPFEVFTFLVGVGLLLSLVAVFLDSCNGLPLSFRCWFVVDPNVAFSSRAGVGGFSWDY